MSEKARLPRWLKFANPVIVALQRRGVVIGTMRLLSVPGRKSGKVRTTPVSPLMVDGERYIIAGLEEADWVKNVRIAGWGILGRGRDQERVNLVELPLQERAPVLREFPSKVPHGVQFFSATLRYSRRSRRVRSVGVPMSGVPGGGGWAVI
jgi:hypothetical protein